VSPDAVENFLRLLRKSPSGAVFNPWWQIDHENDVGRQAPRIRRDHLRAYLASRLNTARLAIIGEALGYRGGHFTGIAMTSERILLGKKDLPATEAHRLLSGMTPRRTSKPQRCRDGFSEPTATIIWGTLLQLGLRPEQFVLWNAFPWHSFDPSAGMLSNRTPTQPERSAGLAVLKSFLFLFPCEKIVALGRIAASQLAALDITAHCVRHPASGGARLFRQQIAGIVNLEGVRAPSAPKYLNKARRFQTAAASAPKTARGG
jgi:uracil-DNA glycosylase